jgi:2-polyprenyl-3-methyl-5-hydroxy-6-metoxy-1,4-benzoquinol methylase
MKLLDLIHGGYVFPRRVRILSQHLAEMAPREASILDVGCGDGLLAGPTLRFMARLELNGS